MIDDLYDSRLAAVEFALSLGGTVFSSPWTSGGSDRPLPALGVVLVTLAVAVFATNMLLVIHDHSPYSIDRVLLGSVSSR